MRQITQSAIEAFNKRKPFKQGNTQVKINQIGTVELYLHSNLIAYKLSEGDLFISNAGWESNVTKERLNGLQGVNIYQKNHVWYLNGNQWNGSWIKV